MKVKIIGGVAWGIGLPEGRTGYDGDIVEVDKGTADMLVRRGRGVVLTAEQIAEEEAASDVETATAEPPENAARPLAARRKAE